MLFSLLVNNISEALNLGKKFCYADDSYLIFEGNSWNEVCKMVSEDLMDWLQDIGMVETVQILRPCTFQNMTKMG